MYSKEELAQPVGNAKICAEFDWDAATTLVLAKRYKILEMIGADSFKAHDLALDQTVTVRQLMPTSQRDGDTWRQKVQQLASVRNPNFLNVLDVVCDKSGGFVITERPRGQSIAELLSERSRFDLEDVLRIMTPLASALDFAAAFACCPNPISAYWLFTETRRSFAVDAEQRSVSEWPPFLVKLDIWELVRPRPSLNSKEQRGDPKGLAVRQAALLTYELLSGERTGESGMEHGFKPVNELSDAANGILYDGLRGSPLFENSGCFFHRLESADRSGDGNSRALPAPALQTRKYSVALPGTNVVMRKFNRDTERLATGLLGVVIFAALVLAVLVYERHPKGALQTQLKETEAKAQLAQKGAELAISQREILQSQLKEAAGERNALQGQLKETEAKAESARKSAALANSQRDALQALLKKTEAKAQLAQKSAELAASQRDALQGQLKETEERAESAKKEVELGARQREALRSQLKEAGGERDALQNQLKEIEASAQSAQRNADLATRQRDALESQLREAEEKARLDRQNADLVANQLNSEDTETAKPGRKTESEASTQPLGSSVQSAQTTSGPSAALVRVSPTAETVNEENKGVGATEEHVRVAVETSPTPTNEPFTPDQKPANLAQTNESQAAIPLTTASVATSQGPTPPGAKIDRSVKASDEELSLKEFVLEYLRTAASDDVSMQERFFESRVSFYGEGLLSRSRIRASMERYHREWPTRNWEPLGDPEFPKILHSANPHLYEVLQPFTWTVSNGSRHEQGSGTLYVRLWKNTEGEFHIIHLEQQDPRSRLSSLR
jgi:hypothetical protein